MSDPELIASPAGDLLVELPDTAPLWQWVRADRLEGEHPPGHPTASAGAGLVCRCGQATGERLWVRLGPRRKVLCVDCLSETPPVSQGDTVTFRLSRSDLARYVRSSAAHLDETRLSGTVEHVLQNRELLVRVDGWAAAHLVDADELDERPATLDDMRRFWPDKTDDVLIAAAAVLRDKGALSVVTTERVDHEGDLDD